MIITIDGPAAAGKGTLASALAAKYGLCYFDTGKVYRAVGLQMLLGGYDPSDHRAALDFARRLTFAQMNELAAHPDFRSPRGGQAASVVSAIPEVRAALLKMQQDFACCPSFADGRPAAGAIYDGRDTGTVVCPAADIKFFIIAEPEVRAERRYKECRAKGLDVTYEQILEDMLIRDKRDSERSASPLKPAPDAIIFDTSDLTIAEMVEAASKIIESREKNLEK